MNPLRRRSVKDPPPAGKLAAYLVLCGWAAVVLFPLYWLVTSFKLPIQVNSGPSTCRSSTSSRPWTPGATSSWTSGATPCGRTSTPWWSPCARCWPCCWAQPVPTRLSASPTSRASMIGLVAGCLALVVVAVGLGTAGGGHGRRRRHLRGPGRHRRPPVSADPVQPDIAFWIISQRSCRRSRW